MSEPESVDWRKIIGEVSRLVRKRFDRQSKFDDDGEVSPQTVALRDAFYSFPYRTDIFVMDSNDVPTPFGEGRWWTLIKHDFTQPKSEDIEFHGTFSIQELRSGGAPVLGIFGLSGIDFWDLAVRGWPDPDMDWYIQMVPYLIFKKPDQYADDLFMWLWIDSSQFAKRFLKEINFADIYSLVPGPIRTDADLSQRDSDHSFRAGPPSLSKLYEDTRSLVLIPQVPDAVRRTFNLSKQLHTYAYYEDHFYTVSAHYSFLAVEAALYARWSVTLPKMSVVECKGEKINVWHPTYASITSISRKKWGRHQLKNILVDGQKFPHSTNTLLEWCVQQKILTRWFASRVRLALDSRNSFSHLEQAPVVWSCRGDLRFSLELINLLFHSVPLENV